MKKKFHAFDEPHETKEEFKFVCPTCYLKFSKYFTPKGVPNILSCNYCQKYHPEGVELVRRYLDIMAKASDEGLAKILPLMFKYLENR